MSVPERFPANAKYEVEQQDTAGHALRPTAGLLGPPTCLRTVTAVMRYAVFLPDKARSSHSHPRLCILLRQFPTPLRQHAQLALCDSVCR